MKVRLFGRMAIFDWINYILLAGLCLSIVYPFLYLLRTSLSAPESYTFASLSIIPRSLSLSSYWYVFENEFIRLGFVNTLRRTVLGTPVVLLATILAAYPLSRRGFPNRVLWTGLFVFTMFFDGGLIPHYIVVRALGLIDSVWALILPGLITTFTLIIVRNYFMSLPEDIEEAARIDGAGDFTILFRIVVPLSTPILATVALWTIVHHWNAWFDSLIYIRDARKHVLQVVVRRIVLEGTTQVMDITGGGQGSGDAVPNPENIKAATVMITTIPIVLVYPFLQKYFVKGIMVGSLKG